MNRRAAIGGEFVPWIVTLAWILAILFALMLVVGAPFEAALQGFLDGAFGGRRLSYMMATLSRATLIVGMALSVMLSFRAGLFNIGGEGQLVAGGLVSALVAILLPGPPLVGKLGGPVNCPTAIPSSPWPASSFLRFCAMSVSPRCKASLGAAAAWVFAAAA